MIKKPLLVVIAGPTAVGKTSLSIQLAQHYACDIVSADSRQFYRQTNIGTAKPTADELAAVPHHFINTLNIDQTYTVGDYERDVLPLLANMMDKQKIGLLVGGSGLYVRAVCAGLDHFPTTTTHTRQQLHTAFALHGIAYLQQQLEQLDPAYYQTVDRHNPQRLMRALEVCIDTGKPFSSFWQRPSLATPDSRPFRTLKIALDTDRAVLYQRINQRVDAMMEQGLLAEAQTLYPHRHLNALQTVGYTELFGYLEGKYSLAEAVARIKQHTRHYAKRQLTWLRKETDWHWHSPNDLAAVLNHIEQER